MEEANEDWANDWTLFCKELNTNFGIFNSVGDAEEDLDALQMKDNQKITKYYVKFNRLTAKID